MYLIDTNVWLERLLGQVRSDEVGQLFNCVTSDDLSVTDFAFHSIGVILKRLDRAEVLLNVVRDTFVEGSVTLVRSSRLTCRVSFMWRTDSIWISTMPTIRGCRDP